MSHFFILYYVYAAIILAGGIVGYIKAKSNPSLIAGIVSAVLISGAATFGHRHPRLILLIEAFIALVLQVFFFLRYQKTKNPMPALPVIGISLIVVLGSLAKLALIVTQHHR